VAIIDLSQSVPLPATSGASGSTQGGDTTGLTTGARAPTSGALQPAKEASEKHGCKLRTSRAYATEQPAFFSRDLCSVGHTAARRSFVPTSTDRKRSSDRAQLRRGAERRVSTWS
jgi:hypothetical protein